MPTVDPAINPSAKPTVPEASPVVPSYSREPVIPAPQSSHQPSCDAACVQARRQENYQAGYAVGQLIGTVVTRAVVAAVDAHREHKFCKDHPDGRWDFGDGSSKACSYINAEHSIRVYSKNPEVQSEFRSNADKAHDLLEVIQHNVVELQGEHADVPGAQSMLQKSRSDWLATRKIYCGFYLKGEYTDLNGKQQTCDGRHLEKVVPPQSFVASTVTSHPPVQKTVDGTQSSDQTASDTANSIEGFYQSETHLVWNGSSNTNVWDYLRFYSDGTVIEVPSTDTPDEISRSFRRPFPVQESMSFWDLQYDFRSNLLPARSPIKAKYMELL